MDHDYVVGATHIITLAEGTWAHDGTTFYNDYRVKMTDVDAMLAAIKYGGRLRSL